MKDHLPLNRGTFHEIHRQVMASLSGNASSQAGRRLDELIRQDINACDLYLDTVFESSVLVTWARHDSTESAREGISTHSSPTPTFPATLSQNALGYFSSGWPVAYLVATVIFGIGALIGTFTYVSQPGQVTGNSLPQAAERQPASEPLPRLVGQITGMVDCKWADSDVAPMSADVRLGRKYQLAFGQMEITYDTGAKVILHGPVTYEADSNGGYLAVGKLTGKLEKKGEDGKSEIPHPQSLASNPQSLVPDPFVIRTPTATVTDLGTEFGVEVSTEGVTETQVFAGSVRIATAEHDGKSGTEQVVRAGIAVRVNGQSNRIIGIKPVEQKFMRTMPTQAESSKARAGDYAQLVLSMNPLAYYRMERPVAYATGMNAMVVFDSAIGGHHGTAHMGLEYGQGAWTNGRFGNAIYLGGPGTDDYAVVKDFPASDTDQLSFSAWVFAGGRDYFSTIAGDATWREPGWQFTCGLFATDGDLTAMVVTGEGAYSRVREGASKPLPLSRWQHVAFVADGRMLHLYRNGALVGTAPCPGIRKVPPIKHLMIGCYNGLQPSDPPDAMKPALNWKGRIDELAIFHHALSAKQVWQLYAGSATAAGAMTSAEIAGVKGGDARP